MHPKLPHLLSALSISDYPASNLPSPQRHHQQRIQLKRPDSNNEHNPAALWHSKENKRGMRLQDPPGAVMGYRGEGGYRYDDRKEEEVVDNEDGEMEGADDDDGDKNNNNSVPIPPHHHIPTPLRPQNKPKLNTFTPNPNNPFPQLRARRRTLSPTHNLIHTLPPTNLIHTLPPTPFRVQNEYESKYDTAIPQQQEYDPITRQHVRRPHQPTRDRCESGAFGGGGYGDVGYRDVGHGDAGHERGWVGERFGGKEAGWGRGGAAS